MKKIDDYGRVSIDIDEMISILYEGGSINDVYAIQSTEITQFNSLCDEWDKDKLKLKIPEEKEISVKEEHKTRTSQWFYPEELNEFDVRDYVLSLCTNDIEKYRVNTEMDLFEARGLIPLLLLMIYLVDSFRQNKIVWGVGRGSSVSSYVLFKIGVHKIDSIKYELDIRDFLK